MPLPTHLIDTSFYVEKMKNKVALVTGGGRRLGRQICLALARGGFDIAVNYNRSKKEADKTLKDIHELGRAGIIIGADVSNQLQVKKMVKKAMSEFGHIDLLVNNAAVFIESPLMKTSERIWSQTIDTNLKGTFLCSQAVGEIMLKRGVGRIINIASLGGIQAWSRYLPYSVSKAGVIMLTKCLAKSLAPRISVNAVAPGTIIINGEEGPMVRHISTNKIPLQKYGKPSDITSLIIFLATAAEYITGQIFTVDGGRSIGQS